MNNNFISDSKGQINNIMSSLVGIIVVFVTLSLGMTLIANFQGNTALPQYKPVPLQDIAFLAVAGVAILALLVTLLRMLQ